MNPNPDEIHVSTNEARAGRTPHIVRYVLAVSLILAIAALAAVWMFGAANAPQDTPGDGISNQAVASPT
ncbi:hypothetical protein KRR38_22210 [Novosphingobium sp. G106]|uniref:hypothetical protein n=1 Tax=Novosphingobium sp. G106 TaxID=2849500 RepID=UPI001C2D5A0E|nr:hypothetical protein [Novosphingobium sp. G106]MBV1690322.1 hypothetical protein [Novosphingobium sp. G106]